MRLKHYNNGTFKNSTLRYWNGSKWKHANLKRWDGTNWQSCIQNPLNDFFIDTNNKCLVEPNGELVRHYNSKYFTSPYVYYYGNKMSYRIVNHYAGGAKEWSMDIEMYDPWLGKLIMTTNILHINPSSPNWHPSTEFKSSISVTNNKVFVFYTPLNGGGAQKGIYVTVLDLNLNLITESKCLSYGGSTIEQYIYSLNSWVTRRNETDYVYTYYDDVDYILFRGIKINYDNGVCVFGDERSYKPSTNSKEDLEDLYKLGIKAKLQRNTGSYAPIYAWWLNITLKDFVSHDTVAIDEYPKSLFEGGATLSTTIEEFKYGGMQRKLNNTKLFGMLLPTKFDTHFLEGCVLVFDLKIPSNWDVRRVKALSGTNANYLTFRKIWGDPSLGYVIYENMNGINLANKILNFDSAKNKIEFRRLPNGQTLMYFDNNIFNFTQKNDKFYISYYGNQIKPFTKFVTEVYGCNKEIIE